ncbi:PDZ domain-containing protein [Syntrophomonas curvata]
MELLVSIVVLMGKVLLNAFTSPMFIIIYLLLLIIVAWQYRRMEDITRSLHNYTRNRYLQSALVSAALGILGGLLGSILLIFIGIDLSHLGIMYLWLAAVLLMLVNPRFLCFAYAGGILSLISLAVGYPDINIAQLMGLIAVLHMVESMLILLNGSAGPIPIYLKRSHSLRGGFNLQYFWPIPLIALMANGLADPAAGVSMPDWWPLIKDYSPFDYGRHYSLLPVLAVLGYGEICSTRTPEQRVKKSARNLFGFSIILLLLAILSSHWGQLTIIAALFSPLGHEFVIWLGMREESTSQPIYVKPPRGIMVLEVKTASPASRSGIRSRDVILSINGEPVNELYAVQQFLSCGFKELEFEILREGQRILLQLTRKPWQELGVIPVPDNTTTRYLTLDDGSLFGFTQRIGRKLKKR